MMDIIESAIRKAVSEFEQDESLANVLIAWYRDLASKNESIENASSNDSRIYILMEKTKIEFINDD